MNYNNFKENTSSENANYENVNKENKNRQNENRENVNQENSNKEIANQEKENQNEREGQILNLDQNFKKSTFFEEKFENLGSNLANFAKVAGFVRGNLQQSHEIEGEKFYEFSVEVERLSKTADTIPVTVSERILAENFPKDGQFVEIVGEYRSYNKLVSEKSRLILHLFAKDMRVCSTPKQQVNEVRLVGFICKPPIYRRTPFEREICDILLAINRTNNKKSDYIPCILWGRNARFVANQPVGSKVELTGRIQSRQYSKQLENGEKVEKTAYEVSCQSVSVLTNISSISAKTENAETEHVVNN